MKSSRINWISADDPPESFPNVEMASNVPNGLLATGGDLSEARLLHAYRHGIFPWFSDGQPILWWSPDPRCVIKPDSLHISKRLTRYFKNSGFEITFNRCFSDVLSGCSKRRIGQESTWITDEMYGAYRNLHDNHWAHSIEVWRDRQLLGGLYGLAIDKVFFGESMFSDVTNASKAAMLGLCSILVANNFVLLDCQVESPHLLRMGAKLIPRHQMSEILNVSCASLVPFNAWPTSALSLADLSF